MHLSKARNSLFLSMKRFIVLVSSLAIKMRLLIGQKTMQFEEIKRRLDVAKADWPIQFFRPFDWLKESISHDYQIS